MGLGFRLGYRVEGLEFRLGYRDSGFRESDRPDRRAHHAPSSGTSSPSWQPLTWTPTSRAM